MLASITCLLPHQITENAFQSHARRFLWGFGFEPTFAFGDTVYFCIIVCTTVGYGCLVPTTPAARTFTAFYCILAIPTFALVVTALITPALMLLRNYHCTLYFRLHWGLARCLGLEQRYLSIWIDDPRRPPSALLHYVRGFSGDLFFQVSLYLITGMLYTVPAIGYGFTDSMRPEEERELTIFTGLYYTTITATSTGLGDICPRYGERANEAVLARTFACITSMMGIAYVGMYVNRMLELISARSAALQTAKRLTSWAGELELLEGELLSAVAAGDEEGMNEEAQAPVPHVTKLEFVLGMLTHLGKIDKADVEPILERFNLVDIDRSGTITPDELRRLREQLQHEATQPQMRRKLTATRTASSPDAKEGRRELASPMGAIAAPATPPAAVGDATVYAKGIGDDHSPNTVFGI